MANEDLKRDAENRGGIPSGSGDDESNSAGTNPQRPPRKRSRRRSILTVFGVTAVILLGIFSRIDNWKRDLTTNYARLDAAASDEELHPVQVSETPTQVADRVELWASDESKWELIGRRETDKGIELEFTRTTGVMRFVDDIHAHLDASEGGTYLRADSRSRVGKGDLGQNPRNLKELVGVVTASR
ncbi:MAG: DUF1499 domain-containing protein [Rubripirellula sp.]